MSNEPYIHLIFNISVSKRIAHVAANMHQLIVPAHLGGHVPANLCMGGHAPAKSGSRTSG